MLKASAASSRSACGTASTVPLSVSFAHVGSSGSVLAQPSVSAGAAARALVALPSLNAAQVELLRKVAGVKELARFNQALLLEAAGVPDWSEQHVLAMQCAAQACSAAEEQTVAKVCTKLAEQSKGFSSSLHFAKLVAIMAQKFPKESGRHKAKLLEALELNTTFLSKTAKRKVSAL